MTDTIITRRFNDVIDAIQTAKHLAYHDDDGIGTVHVNYYDRPLTVVWRINANPDGAVQIAGEPPMNTMIFDWTNSREPRLVTAEFLGRA